MPIIRAFIALQTAHDVQEQMGYIQDELKATNSEVKWEVPAKFHCTLKFLGDSDTTILEKIRQQLQSAVQEITPFDLTYDALGGFPNIAHPRVIWIGAQQSEPLTKLYQHVESICQNFGYAREERKFHTHITFGRVKGPRNMARLTEKLKSITLKPLINHCSAVVIMRSELHPSGSVYTTVNSIPFHQ
ncbi:MAG: RNA 2',3'-cyclic phosphodiesterase [bacterium]